MEIFAHKKPIVGMVHLLPLPGSPGHGGSMERIITRAVTEASALAAGGVDGLLLENFGDRPFLPDRVGPETVAAMTVIAQHTVGQFDLPVGINVLRSDPIAALAIAAAAGASFIRINIHLGARVTDQGILEGRAWETLRYRKAIGAEHVKIFCDAAVKHSAPLTAEDPVLEALELAERGMADAILLTGRRTGEPVDVALVTAVKRAVRLPVWAGSGVNFENIETVLRHADGLIAGTFLKEEGKVENPVDPMRIRRLTQIRDRLFGPSR